MTNSATPIYIRLFNYGYDPIEIELVTLQKDRAFDIATGHFNQDFVALENLEIWVYENEKLIEKWFYESDTQWRRMGEG